MIDVDMSVFVGQDFDCEMLDRFGQWDNIHKLVKVSQPINNGCINYYGGGDGVHWYGCRPRLNHWHFNSGDMVLPDGLVVEAMRRDGEIMKGYTAYSHESNERIIANGGMELTQSYWPDSHPNDWDIIAVKILGTAKGYRCKGVNSYE